MATTTTNANNERLTAKQIAGISKAATAQKNSFKNACVILLDLANENRDAKRVCSYLGLTAEAIKSKNVSETRKRILDRVEMYYTIEGSDTHFPARLRKMNKNAGFEAWVAVPDTYISALLRLAKTISEGNEINCRRLNVTTAGTDDNGPSSDLHLARPIGGLCLRGSFVCGLVPI